MKIQSLHIYPIKSLGGISLKESKLTSRGLYLDRRYILVDAQYKFLTQRDIPQLCLFQVDLKSDLISVIFNQQDTDVLTYSLNEIGSALNQEVAVFDSSAKNVRFVSDRIDKWFSERLEMKCHLVYMPEDSIRPVSPKYIQHEIVSFADGYPFLITNTASLDFLNGQLEQPITMNRFRPNIVVAGDSPFEEDHWTDFKIGNQQFTTPKKCGRCQVVNIDPTTGLASKEVLKTLNAYRKQGNKVIFGMNGCWMSKEEEDAVIRVGDGLEF